MVLTVDSIPSKAEPRAKPGGNGGVTGASWTKGGVVVQRTGKVVFTMGGTDYVCSASAVNDSRSTHSLVLTAGHCAYDEVAKAFATNWTYIPSFDTAPTYTCANSTYGCWTAVGLVVHSGYANAGSFNTQATTHDFAIAIVASGGKSNTQLDALGSYPIAYPAISTGNKVYAFGYPAAGRYKGKDLTYCAGNTFNDAVQRQPHVGRPVQHDRRLVGRSVVRWLRRVDRAGTLTSLNSYGYSGVSNMYGPKFNAKTSAVVAAANSRTSNYIVP